VEVSALWVFLPLFCKAWKFNIARDNKWRERARSGCAAEMRCVAQAGLKLVTLLPQPPWCWDCRCASPHSAQLLVFNLQFEETSFH
jgi:hypothetical protein